MSTPMENLLTNLREAVGTAADEGVTLGEAAAVTVKVGLDLMVQSLGNENTVALLSRIAYCLERAESADLPDLINAKPAGRA
jgi:hypothetical protein